MTKVDIGDPISRVEGKQKVTGSAHYAAEYNLANMCYGVLITSTIANGRIRSIETKAAEKAAGVLVIITHLNAPKIPGYHVENDNQGSRVYGQEFKVFYDDRIYFNHQPVALAVADTLERANYAASLVKITYRSESHISDIKTNTDKGVKPERSDDYKRGDVNAYKKAPVIIEQNYETPIQVHNPMEAHSCTVFWEAEDKVLVYNKTQAVKIAQRDIMKAFNLKEENVHVVSPFVGGAFGSSSRVWPQEMAALIGAKVVRRPVKIMLKRDQAFNMVGYRPRSIQKVGIGASPEGKIIGITHEAFGSTSVYEQFTERIVDPTKAMYNCPNLNTSYKLVPLNMSTPCWTRGPGESSGSFGLESAIDELAYALNIDPIELRLINYAEKDLEKDKPWSSKYLKECFEQGAIRFGWNKRKPKPGSMRIGEMLLGMGMSSGIYKSERSTASISVTMKGMAHSF
jgi:xanthine dehydrogenase YagR molybdenum-binding subunit